MTAFVPFQDMLIIQERDEALQKLEEAWAKNAALEERVRQLEAMLASQKEG